MGNIIEPQFKRCGKVTDGEEITNSKCMDDEEDIAKI